jgi:type II secretory pathway pseudopilin PulG
VLAVARAPAVPIHDPIGETVGRYRIVALLGKGGMGRVYEAEDLELGRRVAIKFLPVAFVERPENLARFVRERVVTADLEHPAIIPLYDSGVWSSGEPYFVMRQVQGDPLHRRLQGARTLEERLLLLPSIIATAEAVAFAHSRGVIHRDLKPANILVGSFGETFVADWGLAKRLNDDELPHGDRPDAIAEPHETRAGVVLGTPAYMAPEQSQGSVVDERADVYAMGAMLHELLVGATPSEGTTETLDPALAGRPRGLTDLPPTMRDLVAITRKALAADPAERYANATELALELRRVQAGQLVDARRYSRSELAWRWMVRHRAAVVVAAAMTATLAVVVLVSLVRIVRERDQERADRAAAEAARQQAAERNDALVLQEARAELDRDPTSSLAWLKQYPAAAGGWSEAVRIAADAVARGVATRVWTLGAPLGCVAFSPDGKTLAIGATDGTLTLLDVETSKRRSFRAPDGVGTRVVFSPDGSVLATTDTTDAARLWNAATGESLRLPGDHAGGGVAAFSEDGTMLRTRRASGSDRLWSIPSGELVSLPSADSRIAFAPRPGTLSRCPGRGLRPPATTRWCCGTRRREPCDGSRWGRSLPGS